MMEYATYAASFVAPELPEAGPRYPEWILLARRAYISDRVNAATAARSHTRDGRPVQVSLFAAAPPAVSHLCVHCPGGETRRFRDNPGVVFSRDDLILLDVSFVSSGISDHFVYKADPKTPWLVRIPDPGPRTSGFLNAGIVCCAAAAADHLAFAVAALTRDYMTDLYKLSVFDSRTGAWETRLLPPPSESLRFFPSKVIPLHGSLLGWVDLWRGILVCDVLSDHPELRYIPMPTPMPGNEGLEGGGEPACYRDVISVSDDDLIKVVEVDYEYSDIVVTDPSSYIPEEWTLVTLTRRLDSREWERGHEMNIGDVTASQDFCGRADVLPRFCDENSGTPSVKKMPLGVPTLCEWNDMVYLMCKVSREDCNGWVVGVDLSSNKLEAVSSFYAATLRGISTAYYPSSFTKYLNDSRPEVELNAQTSDGLESTETEDSSIND